MPTEDLLHLSTGAVALLISTYLALEKTQWICSSSSYQQSSLNNLYFVLSPSLVQTVLFSWNNGARVVDNHYNGASYAILIKLFECRGTVHSYRNVESLKKLFVLHLIISAFFTIKLQSMDTKALSTCLWEHKGRTKRRKEAYLTNIAHQTRKLLLTCRSAHSFSLHRSHSSFTDDAIQQSMTRAFSRLLQWEEKRKK